MNDPDQPRKSSSEWVFACVIIGVIILIAAVGFITVRKVQAHLQAHFQMATAGIKDEFVVSNLREIMAGADQYFLYHNGVSSVASATLVGTYPSQYVGAWATVAQERYTPVIVKGQAITASGVAGARTITFGP